MEASFSATRVSSDFLLVHLECPPGLYLDETHNCVCEVRPEVLTCDPFEELVLLKVRRVSAIYMQLLTWNAY